MEPNITNGIGQLMAGGLFDINPGDLNTTGRVFIVCASTDTNFAEISSMYGAGYPDGKRIVHSTLALAIAACLADRGDVILIAPGHSETITAAAGIAMATAGVRVVGLGSGTDRATINFTTSTAATLTVTAQGCSFTNILFVVGIDALASMIVVSATDTTFQNCEFDTNNATMGVVLGILTAATADRLVVNNCRFLGPAVNAGTTTTAQIQYEAAVDIQITNNYFTGKMTQAVLNVTGTVLRGLIANNFFVIATGTKAIAVASASTPFISNNRINVPSGTAPIVAAAGFVAGNVYSAAAGVTAGTASTI